MGTSIEDIDSSYLYEALEEEKCEIIRNYKNDRLVCLDALKIFDFLPIRKNINESDYIAHLWDSFTALDTDTDEARSFSIMPFHLLFMLALQYKILRLYKVNSRDYNKAFTISNGRHHSKLSKPESVFDLALLKERSLPDLLKLLGSSENSISNIKKDLIDNRNDNLAHARGGKTEDPDKLIGKYINALEKIQLCTKKTNQFVAKDWLAEITEEDSTSDFIESRLADSLLTPKDFNVVTEVMSNGKLTDAQWDEMIQKSLEINGDDTILVLKNISASPRNRYRTKAVKVLKEYE